MKRFGKLLLLLAMVLALAGCDLPAEPTTPAPPENATLEVHFLDVGQADCALLSCGGRYMLIDGGNMEDGSLVVSYLLSLGVEELEAVVSTHPHEDHVGGLAAVLAVFPVNRVYGSSRTHSSLPYVQFLDYVNQQGLQVAIPSPGDKWTVGGCQVTVLGPVKSYPELNDTSIVLRIDFGNTSFLFTGDMEQEAERDLLNSGANVQADVLKVGHHGSYTSTGYRLLYEVQPEYAVISVGRGNDYGHPHREPMDRLRDAQVEIYRTDTMGTVIATSDGENISFQTRKIQDPTQSLYIGNLRSKVYHRADCDGLPAPDNRVPLESQEEAQARGFRPCGSCLAPAPTESEYSAFYVPGYTAQEVADWFVQVALDAEYLDNPREENHKLVRKWSDPIHYALNGAATVEDIAVLEDFFGRLGEVEGIPAIQPAGQGPANYSVTFCDLETFLDRCPNADPYTHGYVTVWWYNDSLEIHTAQILIRTDISQEQRSKVLLHEVYQSLGLLQDTDRQDSIIYEGEIQAEDLNSLDWSILRLLYSSRIRRGMDRGECIQVIQSIYD